jgi:hypothetical protein
MFGLLQLTRIFHTGPELVSQVTPPRLEGTVHRDLRPSGLFYERRSDRSVCGDTQPKMLHNIPKRHPFVRIVNQLTSTDKVGSCPLAVPSFRATNLT